MERELSEVKIGALCWNQYTDWPSLLQACVRADELGYDTRWARDQRHVCRVRRAADQAGCYR